MSHSVEGRSSTLTAYHYGPTTGRPVLLIHGFASSTELNWAQAGWLTALETAGRRVIAVDLPGHGGSVAPEELDEYTPSRIRAEILQLLSDSGVRPLNDSDPTSGVDVIGYSLGARLAWEFGASQAALVHKLVLGGPAAIDPLASFDLEAAERLVTSGEEISDESTAGLMRMAMLVPENDMFALLSMVRAIKTEPFDPAESIPKMPVLLVAGDRDELAFTMPRLAEIIASHGGSIPAEQLLLPARSHANAITSRAFKAAAIEFLGR
ncbi:pimeloyl-ACP methyl ester carboxylesterase [Psychromicrobium silvestre]|uniref:Pimeloyl-ACP methyl ester carboxylesterase n=1 Tax=Psychromicrobium silvestre TaxID=1645614 RepID=A0A7Y9S5X5_9MICC|nr:alpha/beta fold hydrolase [Psychromicrobium silvestre]NYE94715.1 pimeloyl-ACP methyl ester carboxylesterase [Psychromicrobium silvestre]